MVARCGWFVRDSVLCSKVVGIEWDLGFNTYAKHEYINRLQSALGSEVGISCDVTSASPNIETRNLSPLFVRCKTNRDMTIEDWIASKGIEMKFGTRQFNVVSWLYLISLTERQIKTVTAYDCFFDVFSNAYNEPRNSQAYLLGVLKLIMKTNKLDIISNFDSFEKYFNNVHYEIVRQNSGYFDDWPSV